MYIRKFLILTLLTISFLTFQNCGDHTVNSFDEPFEVLLDMDNIVSDIHTLNLPNNIGHSKIYIRTLSEGSSALALEVMTSKGKAMSFNDTSGLLDDYMNFQPLVLKENETRVVLLNDSRDRIMEVSLSQSGNSLIQDYEVDLIESVKPGSLIFASVGYEGVDRVLSVGLNKVLFNNYMNSSLSVRPSVSCADSFAQVGRACIQTQMTCAVGAGRGFKVFENGVFGGCVINECAPGYSLFEGSCYQSIRACTDDIGSTGVEVFEVGAYSSCQIQNCVSGRVKDIDDMCVPLRKECDTPIENGRGIQAFNFATKTYDECKIHSCRSGFIQSGNICVESVQSCNLPNAVSALRPYNIAERRYDTCQATECNDAFTIANSGRCLPTSRSCNVANGQGLQDYNSSEDNEYGDCRVTSCNGGYTRNSQRTVCYLTSSSCNIENGEGEMRGNSCRVVGCNSGYAINTVSNSCVRNQGGGSNGGGSGNQGGSGANGQRCDVPNGFGYINYRVFLPNNGNCVIEQCDSGYVQAANNINRCMLQYRECSPIAYGRSRQRYIPSQFRYDRCVAYQCTGNRTPSGNRCREER